MSNAPFTEPEPASIRLFKRDISSAIPNDTTRSRTNAIHLIRLLAPPLLPFLDIPPTRAATAHAHLNQPNKDGARASRPHESEQRFANFCANVDLGNRANNIPEDDEHNGSHDRGDGDKQSVEESENGNGQREPACIERKRHDEDEDKGEAGAREEEAEHPVGH
jgi:hypothetical protein